MLALDPLLARNAAFQLSATATAGVLVISPPLRDALLAWSGARVDGAGAVLAEVSATAAGAALAVLPVQIATFEAVAPLTLPANVLVAPLYEGTVTVAVLAAALGWLAPVADLFGAAGRAMPEAFAYVVEWMARLPGASVALPASTPVVIAAGSGAVLAAWLLHRRAPRPEPVLRGGRSLPPSLALAVVAAGLWVAALTPQGGPASVTVLDVGQGLAVLAEDGGNRVLIDVGSPDGSVLAAMPSGAGTRAGRSLAAIVITHADSDHAGALSEVLRRLPVDRVLAASPDGVPGAPGAVEHEVLSPPVRTAGSAHIEENDRSLVLMVHMGERRVLLPADIEAGAEEWLAGSGQVLRADAVIAPHHGSGTSSTPAFVEAVAPSVVVFSVSAGNAFGHPLDAVVARYEGSGAQIWRTDEDGSIALRSDGTRLWLNASR
jgi:competence protein ComEC